MNCRNSASTLLLNITTILQSRKYLTHQFLKNYSPILRLMGFLCRKIIMTMVTMVAKPLVFDAP